MTDSKASEPSGVPLPDRLERWPIARVKPYPGNPRLHSPRQVNRIVASMLEHGFGQPILVDGDGVIVAGHGRLLAAKRLGIPRVPVVVAAHLTAEQARSLRLADNRLTEDADWDEAGLLGELRAVEASGIDIAATGFTDEDIAELEASLEREAAPAPKPRGPKAGRIVHMLEFDTKEQKELWVEFEGWLRDRARGKSRGAALAGHAAEVMG